MLSPFMRVLYCNRKYCMELETFIKETLTQIYRGVESANTELEPSRTKEDGSPLPKMFLLQPGAKKDSGSGVFFDVAVTVKSSSNAGASAKASLLSVVEINVDGKQQGSSEQISRISFAVNTNQWHG